MAYANGKTDAVKHCYDVYLRISATAGAAGSGYFTPTDNQWKLDGFILSNGNPETSIVKFKDSESTPLWSILDSCWVKIGIMEAEPSLVTSENERIKLSDCTDLITAKDIEVDLSTLSVNKANWNELISLSAFDVDCLFVVTSEVAAGSVGNGIGAAKLSMDANLDIRGNSLNKIAIKLTRTAGVISKFVNFVDVQT